MRFNALPGDFRQDTEFWKRADGGTDLTTNCANPDTDVLPTDPKATCNGTGDAMIGMGTNIQINTEIFRFWQHLSNAGLIAETYTGDGGPLGSSIYRIATVGVNVPKTSLKFGGWYAKTNSLSGNCGTPTWTGVGSSEKLTSLRAGAEFLPGPRWSGWLTVEWIGIRRRDDRNG